MEIKNIDKNFAAQPDLEGGEVITVPSDKVSLFGVKYYKDLGFLRMPCEDSAKVTPNISYLSGHTAGGRVAFMCDSSRIRINVSYPTLEKMYHMPLTGQAGFSLLEVKGEKEYLRYSFAPNFGSEDGYISTSRKLPGRGMRKYILYFPLYNKVKELEIVIEKGSSIKPFNPYKETLPFLYYGSSITQGGCASRPDNAYQSIVTKINHIDHINLGFTGNCKGEKEMAEFVAKTPCSLFIYAYDNNAPTPEHLKQTHEEFFKIFRKHQPNTPVIFVSATNYGENSKQYKKRRDIIIETYNNALKAGDKNVYFLDGKTMYPSSMRESCSVDGAHPNDLGFYFIARQILKISKKALNQ